MSELVKGEDTPPFFSGHPQHLIITHAESIQCAIESAELSGYRATIRFESGRTYLIGDKLVVSGSPRIDLNGSTIRSNNSTVFDIQGEMGSAISLNSGLSVGDKSFTQVGTGLSEGDLIVVLSKDIWPNRQFSSSFNHSGQMFVIEGVDGATHYLSEEVVSNLVSPDVKVIPINPASPEICNGKIISATYKFPIYAGKCKGAIFSNLELSGPDDSEGASSPSCFKLMYSYECRVDNITVIGSIVGVTGVYGIVIAGPNSHHEIDGIRGAYCRHTLTTSYQSTLDYDNVCGVYWLQVTNSTSLNSVDSGFDTHGTGRFIQFKGCTSKQYDTHREL